MREFKPVRWPVPVFVRDHDGEGNLRPTKRGRRDASNRGFWIVISKNAMRDRPWIIEQEKYESRYWVLHFWRLIDFFWFYRTPNLSAGAWIYRSVTVFGWWVDKYEKAAAHLASVECQSRAHEIRTRNKKTHEDWQGLAKHYAHSIHKASNYPFFQAAGWDEERVYQEIVRHL